MMTLKNSLIALSLIFTFMSCNNEPVEIFIDEVDVSEESTFLLKQRITTYPDGETETETFSYNGNDLTSILDSERDKYENNLLQRINYTDLDGSLIDYTLLEYDATNQLNSYTTYNTEGLMFDLAYSSANNLLKVKENDNVTITDFEEYQYTYNTSKYPEMTTYYYEGVLESTIEYIYG
ncbi:hypothetical protein [Algibacter sp. L4_22]|uniref:hypothetical protein n=1 Tax=Algibacter sp. L4_22 TaxID=2942477 RepID=UPI00201B5886|nr:hypothetical protein [Algibacter sp. L4_22]MCL5127713.1 hypothetical protein [Algibacter sp. L4_22]